MADARRKPSAHIHFLLSIGLFFLTAMDMCAIVTVEFHALLGEGIRLPLAKARQTVYGKRGIRAFSPCGAMVSLIFGAIFPIRRFSRGRTGARCSFPSATRPCAHNAKWGAAPRSGGTRAYFRNSSITGTTTSGFTGGSSMTSRSSAWVAPSLKWLTLPSVKSSSLPSCRNCA